jgi:hypothetical protein
MPTKLPWAVVAPIQGAGDGGNGYGSLYRSITGDDMRKRFKSVQVGVYPGDGMLYPRWVKTEYFSRREN